LETSYEKCAAHSKKRRQSSFTGNTRKEGGRTLIKKYRGRQRR
jgi:hypothetical protein